MSDIARRCVLCGEKLPKEHVCHDAANEADALAKERQRREAAEQARANEWARAEELRKQSGALGDQIASLGHALAIAERRAAEAERLVTAQRDAYDVLDQTTTLQCSRIEELWRRIGEAEAACAALVQRESACLMRGADGALLALERDEAHGIGRQWLVDAKALVEALIEAEKTILGCCGEWHPEHQQRAKAALATALARRLAGKASPS